jgi:hypothetical protein
VKLAVQRRKKRQQFIKKLKLKSLLWASLRAELLLRANVWATLALSFLAVRVMLEAKMEAMKSAGITVSDSPSLLGETLMKCSGWQKSCLIKISIRGV